MTGCLAWYLFWSIKILFQKRCYGQPCTGQHLWPAHMSEKSIFKHASHTCCTYLFWMQIPLHISAHTRRQLKSKIWAEFLQKKHNIIMISDLRERDIHFFKCGLFAHTGLESELCALSPTITLQVQFKLLYFWLSLKFWFKNMQYMRIRSPKYA